VLGGKKMDTPTLEEQVEDNLFEADEDMGSFNHGYIQVRLGILFDRLGSFTPVNELSLDVSGIELSKFDIRSKEEIKPDISLYPKRGLSQPRDILKMREMPLLAVEILSPKQGLYEIWEKFRLYFELGIQSCWLVEPTTRVVTVYSSSQQWQAFSSGEVIDEKLGIHIPLSEIFA
jgi:Uma2 family endonuclease